MNKTLAVASFAILSGTAWAQETVTPQQGLMFFMERAPQGCFDFVDTTGVNNRTLEVMVVSDDDIEYFFSFDREKFRLEVTIFPYAGTTGPEEETVIIDEKTDGVIEDGKAPGKEGETLQSALTEAYQHALEKLSSTMDSCTTNPAVAQAH